VRRFIVVAGLVGAMFFAAGGVAAASPVEGHAASVVHVVVIRPPDGSVAVAAKVFIHGRAFPFLIDTGATKSVLNPVIVRKLHLKLVGKPRKFCGVAACATGRRVHVSHWNIGGVALPSMNVDSTAIAGTGNIGFGLLGSDVLSKFGSVTIDYKAQTLTLG
jgi:predicted aspartyl protease